MEEQLKKIRLTLGYSQQEMADILECNIRAYRSYEYETRSLPNEILSLLNLKLNVDLNWLLTGQGDIFLNNTKNSLEKRDNNNIVKNIETFYKRFNKLQTQNELSDFQLSKLTGISEARIEKLGIGKSTPTIEELTAIKSNFDISVDWLLFDENTCRNIQSQEYSLSSDEIKILKKMAQKFNV